MDLTIRAAARAASSAVSKVTNSPPCYHQHPHSFDALAAVKYSPSNFQAFDKQNPQPNRLSLSQQLSYLFPTNPPTDRLASRKRPWDTMASSALSMTRTRTSRSLFPAISRNATAAAAPAAASFRAPSLLSPSFGRSVATNTLCATRHQQQQRWQEAQGSRIVQLEGRRAFSATPSRPRDHHFDTLKFVQRLKDEGFTEDQAVAMMKVLSDVIEER